jgi:hypothetical protein
MTANQKSSAAAGAAEDKDKDGGPAKVATAKDPDGGPAMVSSTTASDLDAMRAELDEMRKQLARQQPAPDPGPPAEPEEPTHVVVLACGDSFKLPNTIATHYHCDVHDAVVPVTSVFALDPSFAS